MQSKCSEYLPLRSLGLGCVCCDMNIVPLQREVSRQTESELVTPPKCSLGLHGYSLKGTADYPIQFLMYL